MQPKGFAGSFFSPDYSSGVNILFKKLNQVRISLPKIVNAGLRGE